MKQLKAMLYRASLSQKLIGAFILLVTVPVVINAVLTYQKTQLIMGEQALQNAHGAISYFQEKIEKHLEDLERAFVDIYDYEPVFSKLSQNPAPASSSPTVETETLINEQLRLYQTSNEEFEQVYFLSSVGHIFYSSYQGKNYALIQAMMEQDAILDQIRQEDGKSVSFMLSNGSDSKLCMAKQIKNIYGNFDNLGIAVVILKDDTIAHLLNTYPYSEDLSLYLVNDNHQVAFRKNVTRFLEEHLQESSLFQQLPGSAGVTNLTVGGKNYRVLYETGEYSNWKYIELLDEQKMLSQAIEINDYFLFVGLFSLLFVWLVAFFTAHSISRPIYHLVRSMEQMKSGHLDSPVKIHSNDEIGTLSRTFNEMQSEIKSLIQNIQIISSREKEMEINYLKAQINPHFIYNVLGSVNWVAAQKNEPEICDAITDLSDLLRYCLDKNSDDIVTVQEDIRWLEKYIRLQRIRYTNDFHCIINVDPLVQGKKIHKLLLQPLVENSLMHGGCGKAENALIMVYIQGTPDGIYFEVTDNGAGMDSEQVKRILETGSGMGLRNVNERLKLYYGEDCGLQIVSEIQQGVSVRFVIPYME